MTSLISNFESKDQMAEKPDNNDELIILTVIANYFSGTRVHTIASWYKYLDLKSQIGLGTVKKAVSKSSGAVDMRKEVIVLLCTEVDAENIISDLITEMHITEPNSGIAFTIRNGDLKQNLNSDQFIDDLFYAVAVTVNEGYAEDVIVVSTKAEIRGATIIPSYSYSHPFKKRDKNEELKSNGFIEEKETVLMITTGSKAKSLVGLINSNDDILMSGKGEVFISKVEKTVGITYY